MIRERKEQMRIEQAKKYPVDQNNNSSLDENGNVISADMIDDEESFGKKKRLAFLDLLITASGNGSVLTDEDIREEVDTFVSFSLKKFSVICNRQFLRNILQMFEGHDTTSAAVSWCLFLMGSNPKIQDRAFQEVDDILGGDRNRPPTMKELGDMKYLG